MRFRPVLAWLRYCSLINPDAGGTTIVDGSRAASALDTAPPVGQHTSAFPLTRQRARLHGAQCWRVLADEAQKAKPRW
jgi:hypothetical protein